MDSNSKSLTKKATMKRYFESKPLRIVEVGKPKTTWGADGLRNYGLVLSNLAIAESNLVKAGNDSAMLYFTAIVKELETVYGFKFEFMD